MARRQFLTRLAALPFLALNTKADQSKKPLHIMMKSAWGSDDPTRAAFVFAHGLALAEAGHEVQIFLTGEATYLMRKATADSPNTSLSLLEEPAPGPVGSRKPTYLPGPPNSAPPPSSSRWSNGPTASSPSNLLFF